MDGVTAAIAGQKVTVKGKLGELTKKFTVKAPCSASAKAKIEKAGGSVA